MSETLRVLGCGFVGAIWYCGLVNVGASPAGALATAVVVACLLLAAVRRMSAEYRAHLYGPPDPPKEPPAPVTGAVHPILGNLGSFDLVVEDGVLRFRPRQGADQTFADGVARGDVEKGDVLGRTAEGWVHSILEHHAKLDAMGAPPPVVQLNEARRIEGYGAPLHGDFPAWDPRDEAAFWPEGRDAEQREVERRAALREPLDLGPDVKIDFLFDPDDEPGALDVDEPDNGPVLMIDVGGRVLELLDGPVMQPPRTGRGLACDMKVRVREDLGTWLLREVNGQLVVQRDGHYDPAQDDEVRTSVRVRLPHDLADSVLGEKNAASVRWPDGTVWMAPRLRRGDACSRTCDVIVQDCGVRGPSSEPGDGGIWLLLPGQVGWPMRQVVDTEDGGVRLYLDEARADDCGPFMVPSINRLRTFSGRTSPRRALYARHGRWSEAFRAVHRLLAPEGDQVLLADAWSASEDGPFDGCSAPSGWPVPGVRWVRRADDPDGTTVVLSTTIVAHESLKRLRAGARSEANVPNDLNVVFRPLWRTCLAHARVGDVVSIEWDVGRAVEIVLRGDNAPGTSELPSRTMVWLIDLSLSEAS